MSRAVYIGGFGNGKRLAKGVSEALVASGHYNDADHFTFSEAMQNPDRVAKVVRGVDVMTHSAGLLAVKASKPKEIMAVGAPLPSSVPGLVINTGIKSARMLGHSVTGRDALHAVTTYNASSAMELAAHPIANLRQLREIARANAIEMAGSAQEAGILTGLYWNEKDDYFRPTAEQLLFGQMLGVEIHMIPGQHDQLPLHPKDTLNTIFEDK